MNRVIHIVDEHESLPIYDLTTERVARGAVRNGDLGLTVEVTSFWTEEAGEEDRVWVNFSSRFESGHIEKGSVAIPIAMIASLPELLATVVARAKATAVIR